MFIDTHAHLNFSAFRDDADQAIQRAHAADVWLINIGSELKTSRRALDYANKYERGVYAAVGLHPIQLFPSRAEGDDYDFDSRGEDFNYDVYEKLASFQKVVAIGEIGLDYYHLPEGVEPAEVMARQKAVFWEQLLLARRQNLPAIIHCRQAHDDMVEILSDFRREYRHLIPDGKPWGVLHCFSGNEDLAWKYFSLGMMISFTGLITFSRQWDDLIRKLPNDKYMIETDCPYMTPEPHRGQRNEPALVPLVAQRIADIKGLTLERVAELTTRNARDFFRI